MRLLGLSLLALLTGLRLMLLCLRLSRLRTLLVGLGLRLFAVLASLIGLLPRLLGTLLVLLRLRLACLRRALFGRIGVAGSSLALRMGKARRRQFARTQRRTRRPIRSATAGRVERHLDRMDCIGLMRRNRFAGARRAHHRRLRAVRCRRWLAGCLFHRWQGRAALGCGRYHVHALRLRLRLRMLLTHLLQLRHWNRRAAVARDHFFARGERHRTRRRRVARDHGALERFLDGRGDRASGRPNPQAFAGR
ncbi:MAG TPA: hypothetical protein VN725_05795, partial [Rhodanobacteraceae bacterium]|nr:hypothetical protein [Rhodanobacteraceae bacterium]